MDLKIFSELDFLPALHTFFSKLNVPVHHIADEPTTAKMILKDTYKDNDTFKLTNDVYFVGMVDDAAFGNKKNSIELDKIKKDYDGILIFGVTLHKRPNGLLPTRSQLAEIARAFNREFYYTPVVVVFKYNNYIAFANTERLKYKQEWREGEKAGKVSLLRDINVKQPHAGHHRILAELEIPTSGNKKVDSFAKLYAYWQEVLSVNILNKKFYKELSNWYFWAIKNVQFPGAPTFEDAHVEGKDLDNLKQEHKATNVIRMLTRLLFVWFLKEKKLIPGELFDLKALQDDILNDINPVKQNGLFKEQNIDSIYYKAILQNLFFATLNCPIEGDSIDKRKRGFRLTNSNYGTMFLMRYEKYFKDKDGFLEMMNKTVPFLNGGLFECLDERGEGEKRDERIWIDGFSDNLPKDQQLVVPDYLFFGVEEQTDLSDVVGIATNEYKQAAVKGLINILESYKFTITENTPIEEDVALDPELLGRVFENLLASYNPETKTTARKQTGSFYTPREIVNYMVDESLIAYLNNAIDTERIEEAKPKQEASETLRQLVSFDPDNPFSKDKALTKDIITALSTCTILDPACGSGAFPMGILQKMVHILQKLDPDNTIWKEVQREKAKAETEEAFSKEEDKSAREQRLIEINEAFDQSINDPDYARKLFLIENCIYGVDIQPIATQISKLRFFISLVVEQKVNPEKENFGIRPLPNLETKFVTANTLIGIDRPKKGDQLNMFNTEKLKELEAELKIVRSKLFTLKSKERKVFYRKRDEELRNEISAELIENGWESDTAQKLASWDPYDQNASSPFFDPEWMFDIKEGFDVVIGNPPYIEFKNLAVSIKNTLKGYKSTTGKYDLYIPFIEKGITVLKSKGLLVFINPTRFLSRDYGNGLKKFILEHSHIKEILDFSDVQIFENATTYTGIFQLTKNITNDQKTKIKTVTNKFKNIGIKDFSDSQMEVTYISQKLLDPSQPWYFKTSFVNKVCDEINAIGKPLENICDGIFQGVSTGKDEVFVITNIDIEKYNLEKEILIPFLKGKDIGPYDIKWSGNYVIYPYDNQGKVMSENHLSINYPNVLEYLKENRHKLKGRGYFDKSNKLWFELWNQRNIKRFSQKKIVTLDNASQNSFAIDRDNFLGTTTTYSIVLKQELQCFYETILIQLNSSLLNFYHKHNTIPQSGGFFRYQSAFIKGLPVYLGLSSEIGKILYSFTMKHREIGQSINDAVVFNIYFSDHMRERNIDVLKFIEQNIENILQGKEFEKISEDEKENVIEQLHTIWTNPNNEVVKRMSMFRKKSPDILGVILDS